MAFEGLICPVCSNPLDETMLEDKMICPNCSTNLKQKKISSIFGISHDAWIGDQY